MELSNINLPMYLFLKKLNMSSNQNERFNPLILESFLKGYPVANENEQDKLKTGGHSFFKMPWPEKKVPKVDLHHWLILLLMD